MFTHMLTVRMHDTDAAGVLYFASVFRMIHEAYEALMDSVDQSLAWFIEDGSCLLPIVHAEADYKAPASLGARLAIEVTVPERSERSFTTAYMIKDDAAVTVATARLVHVALDPATGQRMPIPETLEARIAGLTA